MLVTPACSTTATETHKYALPTLDAFEPERIPTDLITEPMIDADLLHNSVQYEFALYEWQDYADALKRYLNQVRALVGGE